MNPLTSPFHRTVAVVAGTLLGLAGVAAIAAPASAHHATVTGQTSCEALHPDGSWTITWAVTNSQDNIEGELTSVRVEPADSVTNIVEGATLPLRTEPQLTGEQIVPAAAAEATLTVDVTWDYGNGNVRNDRKSASVQRPEPCPTTPPTKTPPTTTPPTTAPPTTTPPTTTPPTTTPPTTTAPPTTPPTTVPPTEGSPTPSPVVPGDGGGELPKTGVAVGGIAAGAAALLAVGAGLFFLARRRRMSFSA